MTRRRGDAEYHRLNANGWTLGATCPECEETILYYIDPRGDGLRTGVGRAMEAITEALSTHARKNRCDLTCGEIEFFAEAVRS